MPVLITGAQGFIGSWLAERLLDEGARVVALQREADELSYFCLAGIEARCDLVDVDLLDRPALRRLITDRGIRAVFHLAAHAEISSANRSPVPTFETNIRGTWMLLEACHEARTVECIVVASSDKAYGHHERLPYREHFPLQPVWPYEVSKACGDLIARSYAATFGMPVAVTRLANVYGGGDSQMSRIVPETACALIRGERPAIRSDGTPERDYLYAEDAIDAYLAVAASLDDPRNYGRAWNAGSGVPVAAIDVVRSMIAVSGLDIEPDVVGDGTPEGEIDRQYLDSTALREELAWTPKWDLSRGLAATYAWYEEHLGERLREGEKVVAPAPGGPVGDSA